MEYLTEDGRWERDGTSDLGRISRQQDFLRRTVSTSCCRRVFYDPDVVGGLIDVSKEYIVTDTGLTPRRCSSSPGCCSGVDPAEITTYQIEAEARRSRATRCWCPHRRRQHAGDPGGLPR